ncbi:MAG: DNA primase, partial [Alphaproteobacteria bacterium]|nr:DNA primase [Alphaproteobacteria bacterium]
MAFPPDFLEQLRERVSLVDIVSRHVKLQRRGREYVGLSPFKQERTPSFTVVPDKGFFHCFSSGEHGDVIGFLMRLEGLSFPEAVEKLAQAAGLEVPQESPEAAAQARRRRGLQDAVEAAAGGGGTPAAPPRPAPAGGGARGARRGARPPRGGE